MISSLRKYATGWLGILLLVLIGLPFALSGVYSYVGGGGINVVAKVDDREITDRDYQRAYALYRQRLQAMLGRNFRPELIDDARIRREALDGLINDVLISQTSLDEGFRVGAADLARTITGNRSFQTEGRFDRELYLSRLATRGMTPEGYEESLRTDLLGRQLLEGIGATALVTPGMVAEVVRLQEQTRDVAYTIVAAAALVEGEVPDEEALAAFYRENGKSFTRPERVSVDYIDLSVDRLAEGVAVDEEALRRRYEEQADSLTSEAERRARHILVAVPPEADAAAVEAARTRIVELRERLLAGAEFAELAKANSDDPGSAEQGGDLGFFGRGLMDPAFEEAAFSQPLNEIGDPVRSAFGFHLVEVTESKGGERKSFAEVRDDLEKQLRRREAEELFFEQAETLATLAYEHPDSLDAAADALGVAVQRSPWLTRDGADWDLAQPRLLDAAFAAEVLIEGLNSEVVELANDHVLVLRLAEREPARQPELQEVREAVVERYLERSAREAATARGEALLARLRGGETLSTVAVAEGLEPVTVSGLRRDDREHPAPVVRAAFSLQRPTADRQSYGSAELPGGNVALVELATVADGDIASFPDEERKTLAATLARVAGNAESAAVIEGLRARSDIRIFEEKL